MLPMTALMPKSKEKGPPKMRAIEYERGPASSMHMSRVDQPPLRDGEVIIKVYAAGINRADVVQRKGNYPPPDGASDILGLEVCGIIHKVSETSSKWHEGDYVMALLSGGAYAEFVNVHENLVMPVPKGYNYEQGAAIPENWITAYQLLHKVAQIHEGQTVLIHAGGSGVGLSALQLVKMAGCDAIVTAGTEAKLAKAMELGATAAINYKEDNVSQKVLEATSGKGVNIILDCVGISMVDHNLNSISMDGCWVLYGLLSEGVIASDVLKKILMKRIRLQGSTLRARSLEYRSQLIEEFVEKIIPLFENGSVKPVIDSSFPFGKIVDAHLKMERNENIGKIILLVRGDAYEYEDEQ